jgi:hypothetical protein
MYEVDYHIAQELAKMIDRDKSAHEEQQVVHRHAVFARLLARVWQKRSYPPAEEYRFGAVTFEKADDMSILTR